VSAARQTVIAVATRGAGLYELTDRAAAFVGGAGAETGLLTLFVRHTSCSLLIQENADPDVRRDLRRARFPGDAAHAGVARA
jgi:secondary thiamine-phosphate synthase enzyme